MIEKRNFITELRTPHEGLEKDASFEDDLENLESSFTREAIRRDNESDKEHYSETRVKPHGK